MMGLEGKTLVSVALLLGVLCRGAQGRSNGADSAACSNMMPQHGAFTAATSSTPYTVSVSQNTYTNGDKITVTLSSPCNETFKGFMIQARDAASLAPGPIGSFNQPSGTKYMATAACGSDTKTVTHASATGKTEVVLEWTAPAGSTAHIVFAVTFVKAFASFWVMVYSEAVTLNGAAALTPAATFPTPHLDCTNTTTPIPTAPAQSGVLPKDDQCGVSKSCFQDCGDNGECQFIVSWKPEGDKITFELKGSVSGDGKWVALGFSNDDKMGDDQVLDCAVSGTNRDAYHSNNVAGKKENNRVKAISYKSISLVNNVIMCELEVSNTSDIFDLTTKYTLLFATGNTAAGSTAKTPHSFSPLPPISSEVADLQSSTQVIGGEAPSSVLVKAHGSLMITAWVLLASFGLVVARYYRKLGGSKRWCSLHIWFQLHRLSMILTFILSAIGFIIIFVDVQGYSQVGMGEKMKFLQAHPILGIISTALVVLNPLLALCRPHPDTPRRPIFNWVHWGVGTAAWIISIVTIFLGFEIEKAGVDPITKYILAGFVAYQLLLELILEVYGCMERPGQKHSVDEYEMKNATGKTPEVARHSVMNPGRSGAGVFRSVLLLAHGIILIAFLIAILYFVNAN